MCDHHLATGQSESQQATYKSPYEKFIDAVEAALGHSLDGIQWVDGYSLDYARDFYNDNHNVDDGKFLVEDFVRNVRADKKLIELGEYIHEISARSLRGDRNEDGEESRWDEVTLYVGKATDAFISRYVEDRYPAEHCQHEYDCCAHWYAYRAQWKRSGNIVVVKQAYFQNI